jgi:BirA family biotin operon repressor/biotin-[acetyl-CoA-carboxylase] ligase
MTARNGSRYNHGMTLSPERIASFCRPAAQQVVVRVVEETGSTNADLLAALDNLRGPALLVARTQTAGRGRAGRSWLSEPGKSLTFSLAWKFHLPVQALVGLPLAVGVAIAEALAMFEVPVRLKWPNDVLHEGRKLAGILIESAGAGSKPHDASWAVIGIGVNMAPGDALVAQVGRPVARIPWLAELDQDMLLATLLNGLADAMVQFEQEGLQAFVPRWNALHAYAGQHVNILDGAKVVHEGVAVGVDEIGRFVMDTAQGRIAIMAGDVSLRPREA